MKTLKALDNETSGHMIVALIIAGSGLAIAFTLYAAVATLNISLQNLGFAPLLALLPLYRALYLGSTLVRWIFIVLFFIGGIICMGASVFMFYEYYKVMLGLAFLTDYMVFIACGSALIFSENLSTYTAYKTLERRKQ